MSEKISGSPRGKKKTATRSVVTAALRPAAESMRASDRLRSGMLYSLMNALLKADAKNQVERVLELAATRPEALSSMELSTLLRTSMLACREGAAWARLRDSVIVVFHARGLDVDRELTGLLDEHAMALIERLKVNPTAEPA